MTDEELGERLKNGDTKAIAFIYERFKNGLYLFCFRLLSDSQAAEDVVHETFLKMINGSSRLKNPAALKSWMFTIARNESFDHLNKHKNMRELNEHDENIFQANPATIEIESSERSKILEELLDQMLPQYKEVLILKEYESMTYEEIACVTGTTLSSVKSRLFKARKVLMGKLLPLQREGSL